MLPEIGARDKDSLSFIRRQHCGMQECGDKARKMRMLQRTSPESRMSCSTLRTIVAHHGYQDVPCAGVASKAR